MTAGAPAGGAVTPGGGPAGEFATGTFSPDPRPSPTGRRITATGGLELRMTLRNGEQLLLALIIPLLLFVFGTRLWALGQRNGFITPVQMFRDRWECAHIGTVIFVVQAVLLVPYIIIAVMGGGTTLEAVSAAHPGKTLQL